MEFERVNLINWLRIRKELCTFFPFHWTFTEFLYQLRGYQKFKEVHPLCNKLFLRS